MTELSADPRRARPGDGDTAPALQGRAEQDRARRTRARLIDAAITALMDGGLGRLTLQRVADLAGTTKGAVQYHFRSKADLVEATLDTLFAGGRFARDPHISAEDIRSEPDLERRCALFVASSMRTYGQRDYYLLWDIIIGTRLDPVLDARARAHREKVVEDWIALFRAGFSDLALPDERALALVNFVNGHLRGISLLQRYRPLTETEWREQTDLITRSLFRELQGAAKADGRTGPHAAGEPRASTTGRDR